MSIEWRYLKMLKRAGRGHIEGGAAGTGPGELAVLCPACPHPGVNMAVNWKSIPRKDRYDFSGVYAGSRR